MTRQLELLPSGALVQQQAESKFSLIKLSRHLKTCNGQTSQRRQNGYLKKAR